MAQSLEKRLDLASVVTLSFVPFLEAVTQPPRCSLPWVLRMGGETSDGALPGGEGEGELLSALPAPLLAFCPPSQAPLCPGWRAAHVELAVLGQMPEVP